MSTFKEIRGFTIKKYTTNPTNPLLGEMWYNNTTGTLKVYTDLGGTFASGGALNVGRNAIRAMGTQTSALAVGGDGSPGPSGATEQYNGTAWTTSPAVMSPTRNSGGMSTAGTVTAAWYAGGSNPGGRQSNTSHFDGSAGTAGGTYPLTVDLGGAGTETAGLAWGGTLPGTWYTTTNKYDGTSWTATGSLNTGRTQTTGCGIQTAALSAGGETPSLTNASETFDGSTWTSTNNLTQPNAGACSFGTTASAQYCGGTNAPAPNTTDVQSWDGTSWAANPASLATAVTTNGGAGATGALGFSTGGNPFVTATEEYTDPSFGTQTVTTS